MRPRKNRLLWLFLSPALFCVLWPVWFTLTAAFRSSDELVFLFGPALGLGGEGTQTSTWTLLPCWPTLQPILQLLLDSPEFFVMFGNSLVQTIPQVIGSLLVAAPAAWALARHSFPGRRLVWGLYFLLMVLPFQVSMVPTFLVLRRFGLLDTHWAIILPGMFAAFPVFFLRRGFERIPDTCLEAAHLDGANEWTCFLRIGLPLISRALFAVMTLQFWECWNSIEQPLAFLRVESFWPLSLLKNVRTEYPKTDPSYRVIPISKELGLMLEQEREKIEQQYGNVDVLLRLGRPDGNIYRVDSQALASNVHELTEQIPELLRQPAIVDALRKNRAYEFDLLRQNKKLESMLTCHALRRGFCTWLYGMSGVDTNDIYQIMGHANKNIPHRSGPHGATQSELYRMCLQKHVSDTFCHSAQPLKYTLGKKYRQSEVPACVIELTVPPQTEWEVTVEDTEPSTQVEFSGEGVSWSFEYQYDVKPNPTRYALLAKKEEYTIVEKQSFVTALLKDSYK